MTDTPNTDIQENGVNNPAGAEPAAVTPPNTPDPNPAQADAAKGQEDGKTTDTLLSDDGGEGADGKDKGAPEAYEFTPPEGFEISEEVQKALETFNGTAKELGLTQEQYQKLVEFDIQRGRSAIQAASDQYTARINGWAETVRADPELGGEQLKANLAIAKQAIDAFGSPELAKLISAPSEKNPEGLGLGNHPELIRFMYRVGKSIGEDRVIEGDGRKVDDTSSLQKMYPTMFKEAG